jgi:lipopolysaccharide export LptBFGC system permease protein LptF
MKTALLAALAVTGTLQASLAWTAPRAESAQECAIAADMAIVARSLAQERIDPDKANAIMTRVYDVAESERGRALMKDILEAAYKDQRPSQRFAEQLFSTCMKSAGNMDTVLGSRL